MLMIIHILHFVCHSFLCGFTEPFSLKPPDNTISLLPGYLTLLLSESNGVQLAVGLWVDGQTENDK